MMKLKLSIVIPAHNEEANIGKVITDLADILARSYIPYELIVVNDNSTDGTAGIVESLVASNPSVHLVSREPPSGFGRAIRSGLGFVTGDVVVICMADQSDDPRDVLAYYQKIQEGYDCVFGSRFIAGAEVHDYPRIKLICNRIINRIIQVLFLTRHNDMTNAFKAYRTYVIRECEPYKACHFNITIEMSLSALIRGYAIARIPIRWYGRVWGSSKLALQEMGRRYLVTLLKIFFEKILIHDDLMAERMSFRLHSERSWSELTDRLSALEKRISAMETRLDEGPS
jgi:dolichol-phosphate mannosyltransferase